MRVVVKLSDAPEPLGCRWCGMRHGAHLQVAHKYERPTRAQHDARLAAIGEGPNPGEYRVPLGLCANREDHVPHLCWGLYLFYCHANQARRQSRAAERVARARVPA